mmetsp:Transcript_33558/g.79126  ORF Transcript_33558/g.79126 Transcript_33558/m.79126 type:complete len:613 (+) Transcript_33558:162-2000(+)
MGNAESGLVDDAEISKRTAKATAAEYARASKIATAAAKSRISEFYPPGHEVPHSSISVQRETSANQQDAIEATLPRQHDDDTRDQHAERSKIQMERDNLPIKSGPGAQSLPQKPYKLANGDTVHMVQLNRISSPPKRQPEPKDETREITELSPQDIEANRLLQNILHLDTDVTEATAAVYHYFQTKKVDDEMTARGRSRKVVRHIKEELKKGNSKPAYQFLETARTVLPVLEEERHIDVEAGLRLEADIFSEDSEDAAVPVREAGTEKRTQNDGARSISDQTAAIFEYLETTKPNDGGNEKQVTKDPMGSKHAGHAGSSSNIFRVLEESEENGRIKREVIHIVEDETRTVLGQYSDLDELQNFNASNVEDMDLEFVENFDLAYSEFLYYHPRLVAKSPEMMQNLRIYKLQKLLEYNEVLERKNAEKLDSMNIEKRTIEEAMLLELKDAIRKKAALQTFMQSEVNNVNLKTKQIQTKLRWKVLKYSEDRAKRQVKLREQFEAIPHVKTRREMLPLIPDGLYNKKLETAIKASFIAEGSPVPDMLSASQEDQLREIQVENSMINSEIAMLNKRLANLRSEANKLEWVQPTLMEMNPATMHKLKEKIEKQEGVSL